jgi:5-(carboxyamino)imidazole ribonucleotide mutase
MSTQPLVGIVMGSDSDWPVMEAAAEALAELDVPVEVDVVSAHRQPDKMVDYGRTAADRGLRVIPLRVVGVPVPLAGLDGLDSLLSIVQMPAGVPVATVSIGGARNAGLLAARILAAGTDETALRLRAAMVAFQDGLRAQADAKGERLRAQHGDGRRATTGFGI